MVSIDTWVAAMRDQAEWRQDAEFSAQVALLEETVAGVERDQVQAEEVRQFYAERVAQVGYLAQGEIREALENNYKVDETAPAALRWRAVTLDPASGNIGLDSDVTLLRQTDASGSPVMVKGKYMTPAGALTESEYAESTSALFMEGMDNAELLDGLAARYDHRELADAFNKPMLFMPKGPGANYEA